ncbi:hypothetical protein [Labrys sp. ZIDIC5]|uniref:hypothetical protein n=1 Tax=Labrys sedimenti TaxID=3106036 RepID=UPI002ACA7FD1|nr:hypothetical protein [Labrys sp. ZIDIC5]MDZ5448634.1 hypothetical protein [Labrys sp. ZIDIC5]
MSIFDDIARHDLAPPLANDTDFSYLNRSNRVEATRVRVLVDSWFERYPLEDRGGLAERFRSSINHQHKSAFFELFLHEFVLATGHRIIAIEPPLAHTRYRPDFLVESPGGGRFYLEAVLATGLSDRERAEQARLDTALALIDRADAPQHFLDVTTRGAPTDNISGRKLMRGLNQWIAALPDGDAAADIAPFCWEEHGVRIELKAWPRLHPGAPGRAIGIRHFPFRAGRGQADIREAVVFKAEKYGVLDHPLVIAVNSFEHFQPQDDLLNALFGSVSVAIRIENGRRQVEERRAPDGVWWGPRGARKKGVGAVLAFARVDPWNFASRHGCLVINPWATLELPPLHFGIDEVLSRNGNLQRTQGATLGQRLGLPGRWPET